VVLAARWGHAHVLEKLLLRAGCTDTRRALQLAALHGHADAVSLLLSQARPSTSAAAPPAVEWLAAPLRAASSWGHLRCVEALLSARADPDATDERGRSALHAAAAWGCEKVASALVAAGADTASAYSIALANGHERLAELLQPTADLPQSHDVPRSATPRIARPPYRQQRRNHRSSANGTRRSRIDTRLRWLS